MIIKERPEDFIVEEITPSGEILEVRKNYSFKENGGKYLTCVLEKKDWETNRAIKYIAKKLHVSYKRIGFAGTKDKRAVTTQRISIFNADPEDAKKLDIPDMRIIPITKSFKSINLGDLQGNRFTILVKGIDPDKFHMGNTFKVPNSFGVQRFGERRPVTHLVGKMLVGGNVEDAVKTYIGWIGDGESDETKDARKRISYDWDWKSALKYFPERLTYERTIISHLAEHPHEYANALRKLPENLIRMLVHAYQSYLFNEYLIERMNKIGLDEFDGDILEDGVPTGPLFGFAMNIADGKPGEIERDILRRHKLHLTDFDVRIPSEASSKGGRRKIYMTVKNYNVLEEGDDWVKVQFSLGKGSYATTVLDWLNERKIYLPSL